MGPRLATPERMTAAPSTSHAADGTRSVPEIGGTERGWDSVEVQAADVLACQGFLPERHTGENRAIQDEDAGLATVTPPTTGEECQDATSEPKISDDVLSLQYQDSVEVTADLGGESGLDKIRTNPTPACGRKEGEVRNSKDEGASSKSEIRNPKSEGDRDPGGDGQDRDAGCADVLSRMPAAGAVSPGLCCGERERENGRSRGAVAEPGGWAPARLPPRAVLAEMLQEGWHRAKRSRPPEQREVGRGEEERML